MKAIALTQGKIAIVDDDDYSLVMRYKWCAVHTPDLRTWYAVGKVDGRQLYMHRFLLDARRGELVDHEDNDGLNNRRGNLRRANYLTNRANARKFAPASSCYKGVFLNPKCTNRPWQARIKAGDRPRHLGNYRTQEEAARAYDTAALHSFGEFAQLNF